MDDLRPDQWVTIRDEIKDVPMSPFGADPELHQFVMRMRSRTPVKPGTPMRVIAVDLPFLYTVVLDADGQEQGPLILDVRRFRVVEICTSVPQAILEFADVKLRSNYEHSLATAATEAAVEAKAEIVKLGLLGDAMNGGHGGDSGDGVKAVKEVKKEEKKKAGLTSRAEPNTIAITRTRPPQTATRNQEAHPRIPTTATKANRRKKNRWTAGIAGMKTGRRRRGVWGLKRSANEWSAHEDEQEWEFRVPR